MKKSPAAKKATTRPVKSYLLDAAQVAQKLAMSRSSVYNLIHAGRLKAATFGPVKGFRVWSHDLQIFIDNNTK